MIQIILLNKPFNVLSQFQDDNGRSTLKDLLPAYPGFYAAGRLDYDSEGLLLLTNNGQLQHRISDPAHKLPKTYWVQVEGNITSKALEALCNGVMLNDGKTKPAQAKIIEAPDIWERTPPIRKRINIPTSWISLTIREGRNRQVRRMTASTGFPTLRLIRISIGDWNIDSLLPGEHRLMTLDANDAITKEISATRAPAFRTKPYPKNNNADKKPASRSKKTVLTRKPR